MDRYYYWDIKKQFPIPEPTRWDRVGQFVGRNIWIIYVVPQLIWWPLYFIFVH